MLSEISLYRLSVFCEVVDSGGFSAAAQKLNISQPAVSDHIHGIEDMLGVPILEKSRKIKPTEAGVILYKYAKHLQIESEKTSNILAEIRKANLGWITIGISTILIRSGIPSIISAYIQENQNAEIDQYVNASFNICEMVRDGKLDCGIITTLADHREFISQTLGEDEFIFVVGSPHPLYGNNNVLTREELSEYQFILPRKDSEACRAMERIYSSIGMIINKPIFTPNDVYWGKVMLDTGFGIGTQPKLNVMEDLQKGTLHRISPDVGRMPFQVKIIYQSDKYFSPIMQKFLKFLLPRVKELYNLNSCVS